MDAICSPPCIRTNTSRFALKQCVRPVLSRELEGREGSTMGSTMGGESNKGQSRKKKDPRANFNKTKPGVQKKGKPKKKKNIS